MNEPKIVVFILVRIYKKTKRLEIAKHKTTEYAEKEALMVSTTYHSAYNTLIIVTVIIAGM